MSTKLITIIIGQDCQDTIGMCLESVKEADEIIYLDGGSKEPFYLSKIYDKYNARLIHNKFNKEDPEAISKQRNFYLDYLKENYNDEDYILVLDADEVLDTDGIKKIKEQLEQNKDIDTDCYYLRMRHLMYTLGFEDVTQQVHFVPKRLFKLGQADSYPDGEHTILKTKRDLQSKMLEPVIWHLGYLGGVWDVKKRFDQQVKRNNGHDLKFLNDWNKTHMLGNYPIGKVNSDTLPKVILENFGLNEEELYFENRSQLEAKHGIFVKQWNEFFKPESVADFGCGKGLYLYFWEMTGADCEGFEYSEYAQLNKICKSSVYGINLNMENKFNDRFNLVTALDVLEHLEYDKLDNAINTLVSASDKYILTSIPYKGTPNFSMDKTHIIGETRDWWKTKFLEKGLKEVAVPEDWIFKEQLMIFEK